jgi:hypothetical protein
MFNSTLVRSILQQQVIIKLCTVLWYYDVISHKNKDNIPKCEEKEGGLIRLFIEKIPFEYGKRVLNLLPKAKYIDIYAFLTKFYNQVEEHYRVSVKAKALSECFGGTEYKTRLTRNYNVVTAGSYQKGNDKKKYHSSNNLLSQQRVHHIVVDNEDYDIPVDSDSDNIIIPPMFTDNTEVYYNSNSNNSSDEENNVDDTVDTMLFLLVELILTILTMIVLLITILPMFYCHWLVVMIVNERLTRLMPLVLLRRL